jgi:hypothetical protein
VGSRLRGYGIEGREIVAPPWSFACMTDQGPSECSQHLSFYGSRDALARYVYGFNERILDRLVEVLDRVVAVRRMQRGGL